MRLCENREANKATAVDRFCTSRLHLPRLFHGFLQARVPDSYNSNMLYILKRTITFVYLPPAYVVHTLCIVFAMACPSLQPTLPSHRTCLDSQHLPTCHESDRAHAIHGSTATLSEPRGFLLTPHMNMLHAQYAESPPGCVSPCALICRSDSQPRPLRLPALPTYYNSSSRPLRIGLLWLHICTLTGGPSMQTNKDRSERRYALVGHWV
jgi:hypothetical protein